MNSFPLKRIIAFAFTAIFTGSGFTLSINYFLQYKYSLDASSLAWFTGGFNLVYALTLIFTWRSVRKFNRTRLLYYSTLAFAIFSALVIISPGVISTCIAAMMTQIALAFFWPVMMGFTSEGRNETNLAKIFSIYSLAWSLGAALGPLAAGWLCRGNPYWGLVLNFVLSAVLWLIAMSLPAAQTQTQQVHDGEKEYPAGVRYAARAGLFASFFATSILLFTFPVFALKEFAVNESRCGELIMFKNLVMAAAMFYFPRARFWAGKKIWLPISALPALLALVLMAYGNYQFSLALAMILLGVSNAFVYAQSIRYGTQGADNAGSRMASHELSAAAAFTAGAFCGGLFYARFGLHGMIYSAVIIAAAALLLQSWFLNKKVSAVSV